jgi:alcohol dehydrogenase (cytochrome c)
MLSLRTICAAAGVLALTAVIFAQPPQQAAPAAPMPASLRNYQPVTAERLLKPEDGNWLSIRGNYLGWGYSPLTQITTANAKNLKPVWVFSTGEAKVHESAPVVNNGVMFVTSPNNQVIALDVRTGNVLWRYHRAHTPGGVVLHDTNRGVALFGDKVYYAASEAVLIALDAKTGKEVWATNIADNKSGYYCTLAPLAAGGAIMVGASGGEVGIRGFVAAYDPETGAEKWKTYTIPAPGEPGSETWPKGGDQWKTGGGPVWVTGNYDPMTNTAYWGTGNGGPWMGDRRPGDDLYTASTIALDVATGKIKGHFQYNPNESWDWDEVSPPILVDYKRGARTINGLIDAARDGYLWFLDRGDATTGGRIKFIEGKPFVFQNVYKSLDPETGRPEVDLAHKPGTGKNADFCPGLHGGKNWPPIAYSPQTRMIYIPANNNLCGSSTGLDDVPYTPGRGYTGVRMGAGATVPGADHFGEVQAWNVDTGQKVWTHNYAKSPNWGGMLVTAGGIVFTGGTSDRKLHAFDAKNGKLLWEYPVNSGVLAPPSTFTVDGKQYVAFESGWGGDSRGMQATLNRYFPGEFPEVPEGGAVWVFSVQ